MNDINELPDKVSEIIVNKFSCEEEHPESVVEIKGTWGRSFKKSYLKCLKCGKEHR